MYSIWRSIWWSRRILVGLALGVGLALFAAKVLSGASRPLPAASAAAAEAEIPTRASWWDTLLMQVFTPTPSVSSSPTQPWDTSPSTTATPSTGDATRTPPVTDSPFDTPDDTPALGINDADGDFFLPSGGADGADPPEDGPFFLAEKWCLTGEIKGSCPSICDCLLKQDTEACIGGYKTYGINCTLDPADGYVCFSQPDCDDHEATIYPSVNPIFGKADAVENQRCGTTPVEIDQDRDGYWYVCDCNDSNSDIHPGAEEVCDEFDNDCDGSTDENVTTTYYLDNDDDSYGQTDATTQACDEPADHASQRGDCNDGNGTIYPGAAEVCDTIDNDCDQMIDEGVQTTYYYDGDEDGYGDPSPTPKVQCPPAPASYVDNNQDCNDNDPTLYIGAARYPDQDGDTHGDPDHGVNDCNTPAGLTPCGDSDSSTYEYVSNGDDCNDCDPSQYGGSIQYLDCDGDGFGDGNKSVTGCISNNADLPTCVDDPTPIYVTDGTDCNDADGDIYPNVVENCTDGEDNNCDGVIDGVPAVIDPATGLPTCDSYDESEDSSTSSAAMWLPDKDGDGAPANSFDGAICGCDGSAISSGDDSIPYAIYQDPLKMDCDDTDAARSPINSGERFDGKDNDCDNYVPLIELDLDGDGQLAVPPLAWYGAGGTPDSWCQDGLSTDGSSGNTSSAPISIAFPTYSCDAVSGHESNISYCFPPDWSKVDFSQVPICAPLGSQQSLALPKSVATEGFTSLTLFCRQPKSNQRGNGDGGWPCSDQGMWEVPAAEAQKLRQAASERCAFFSLLPDCDDTRATVCACGPELCDGYDSNCGDGAYARYEFSEERLSSQEDLAYPVAPTEDTLPGEATPCQITPTPVPAPIPNDSTPVATQQETSARQVDANDNGIPDAMEYDAAWKGLVAVSERDLDADRSLQCLLETNGTATILEESFFAPAEVPPANWSLANLEDVDAFSPFTDGDACGVRAEETDLCALKRPLAENSEICDGVVDNQCTDATLEAYGSPSACGPYAGTDAPDEYIYVLTYSHAGSESCLSESPSVDIQYLPLTTPRCGDGSGCLDSDPARLALARAFENEGLEDPFSTCPDPTNTSKGEALSQALRLVQLCLSPCENTDCRILRLRLSSETEDGGSASDPAEIILSQDKLIDEYYSDLYSNNTSVCKEAYQTRTIWPADRIRMARKVLGLYSCLRSGYCTRVKDCPSSDTTTGCSYEVVLAEDVGETVTRRPLDLPTGIDPKRLPNPEKVPPDIYAFLDESFTTLPGWISHCWGDPLGALSSPVGGKCADGSRDEIEGDADPLVLFAQARASCDACYDGLDNDCDGKVDAADEGCDRCRIATGCACTAGSGSPSDPEAGAAVLLLNLFWLWLRRRQGTGSSRSGGGGGPKASPSLQHRHNVCASPPCRDTALQLECGGTFEGGRQ